MEILKVIKNTAERFPDRNAFRCGDQLMTYGKLWELSGALAGWILEHEDDLSKPPIAVYGHKSPGMLICFLACARSGHAYCPIDSSLPANRIEAILSALPRTWLLETEDCPVEEKMRVITITDDFLNALPPRSTADEEGQWVRKEDNYYMIFTSGSTGVPKGVQITRSNLEHFLDWSTGFAGAEGSEEPRVFLNQAPFSFDLSVMDLYTSLACGGTLFCLDRTVQADYRKLMESLSSSNVNVWVSTPSFAEMCLADPAFREELMPKLDTFWFCGETLGNKTARKLLKNFPKAVVYNTYGPTESTVAVTSVQVTAELAAADAPLPVGAPKPGTRIEIRDETGSVLPDGKEGEIIIFGDTVSPGYYGQTQPIRSAFLDGEPRGYQTGDKGYMMDGLLYFCGRMDDQIKLHGYRIELGDIERNIIKLPFVSSAAVVPRRRGGKITSLAAYVVLGNCMKERGEDEARKEIRHGLAALLPEYMIPKFFFFPDELPRTANGKVDRRRLAGGDQ
ncbi:MAG: D-alanine--poly(phosphoribitol) ligase subunit DltA [Blautia sp.]|nr:D-alanine--poly(phosphoribitol) ligase subunit DltA [Blautia sp.]